jgi:uncharacterized membrane protein YhaH (DUF805 family)
MRRPVAAVAAVLLIAEAFAVGFVNLVLGLAVKRQSMSFGGLKAGAMSAGAWAAGVVFVLFLLGCAAIEIAVAVRDRAPGRRARLVLIVCAVVDALLAAAVVGMVGWLAFAALMVVLAAIVLTLVDAGEGRSKAALTPTSP